MASHSSGTLDFSLFNSKDFDVILLILSLLFTVGVIISLVIITRQVMKSKWIDSNSVVVLFFVIGVSFLLLVALWVTYLLYVGIL